MRTSPASHVNSSKFVGDERWELVQRIVASKCFAASARLRDFLLHVAACAMLQTPEDAREQQIGIRVFQRVPGFNTSEDSIVRSQARLLRMKLAAYFAAEGASESIVLQIPKGQYLPLFLPVTPNRASSFGAASLFSTNGRSQQGPAIRWDRTRQAFPLVDAGGQLRSPLYSKDDGSADGVERNKTDPVDALWGPFLSGESPMVIYGNAQFIGNPEEGLRYVQANSVTDSAGSVSDHYTGVGEVQSVFQITRLFEGRGAELLLKRSSLVTWDDARLRNLIFVGSDRENSALKALPPGEDFGFAPGAAGIVNHFPMEGEPETYWRSKQPQEIDYAVLALRPGLVPQRKILVFAGLTTLGTQAAVEFACNPHTASELQCHIFESGSVRNFEAVLEATIVQLTKKCPGPFSVSY